MTFANSVDIKINVEKIIGFEFTRFNGEVFKEYWKSGNISKVMNTEVEWKDKSLELMVKIKPLFEKVTEGLNWEWKDIAASDIQNKFIEFRSKEEKILRGVK